MKNPTVDKTFGQILIEKSIISQNKLDLALRRQKDQKGKYLGQILIEMGVVSQEKLKKKCNTRANLAFRGAGKLTC